MLSKYLEYVFYGAVYVTGTYLCHAVLKNKNPAEAAQLIRALTWLPVFNIVSVFLLLYMIRTQKITQATTKVCAEYKNKYNNAVRATFIWGAWGVFLLVGSLLFPGNLLTISLIFFGWLMMLNYWFSVCFLQALAWIKLCKQINPLNGC